MTSDNIVLNNFVGIDATGKKSFSSVGWGVNIIGSWHNFIGVATAAERNLLYGDSSTHIGNGSRFNFIIGNHMGIDITGERVLPSYRVLGIDTSDNNFVLDNVIAGGKDAGVSIGTGSRRNLVKTNIITHNKGAGVSISEGSGNVIVMNSIIDNGPSVDEGWSNLWDDGRRGNYWSDYKGKDTNKDGLGDTPYQIPPNGADKHPLMRPPVEPPPTEPVKTASLCMPQPFGHEDYADVLHGVPFLLSCLCPWFRRRRSCPEGGVSAG